MWKQLLGYTVLLLFVAVGIAHALRPERFMKPWHRGGEMLTEWNRFGIRIAGIVLAAVSIYILYSIVHT
jgi:hypothetical protein